jgi:ribosome-associated translation inhibitor RaiA
MVRIADLNGPRGGVDRQCRITVDVRPSRTVILEETDADLYRAIDRAAHRVGQSVRRQLERLGS